MMRDACGGVGNARWRGRYSVGAADIQWLRLTLATAVAAARGTNTRAPVATHCHAALRALISSTQQLVTNGHLDRIDECAGPKHFEHCSLALLQ